MICGTERDHPDIADQTVELTGHRRYSAAGGPVSGDAARAVQAQAYREEPVHDVPRELGHRFVKGGWLMRQAVSALTVPITWPRGDGRVRRMTGCRAEQG